MPEIDARIAAFLNEKLAPSPGGAPSSPVRLRTRLLQAVIALISWIERAAARWKARCIGLQSSASGVQAAVSARDALRQELTDHLRDAYDCQIELGRAPDAAWTHVTERFGDYESILSELETLHFVPLWEWVTRALALPLALWLMTSVWYGRDFALHIRDFIFPTAFITLFLAAPLAAFDPRARGWPGWLRWVARGLAFSLFLFASTEEGFLSQECLIIAAGIVLAAALGRPFSSPRFATRTRAFRVAAMVGTLLLCARLFLAQLEARHFQNVGGGVAISFIFIIYGVLFGRPRWPVLLLATANCHWIVYTIGSALMTSDKFSLREPIDAHFLMTPALCTVLALLAGWTFYGRRAYAHWIPAVGVIGMILTYITRLKNFGDPQESLHGLMLAASLPLLLWLVPMAGAARGVFMRDSKKYVASSD